MFRKILIPLDGSPLAEKALLHAQKLAQPDTTELILVTVIETYRYGFTPIDMAFFDVVDYVRNGAEEYLRQQQSQLTEKQYAVQTYILDGDAAQGILKVADATGADLIMMTTHGRSGIARWALGSIATRVIHAAKQPVWLVRDTTPPISQGELRRILVPLDGTPAGEQALAQAQRLAQGTGAELLLLRVVPELDATNRRMLFSDEMSAQTALAQWQRNAEAYLAEVGQRLTQAGIPYQTRIEPGGPVPSILNAADLADVDCIVMATRARAGLDRMLHGSVAGEVLCQCECPMLLVRAEDVPIEQADTLQLVHAG